MPHLLKIHSTVSFALCCAHKVTSIFTCDVRQYCTEVHRSNVLIISKICLYFNVLPTRITDDGLIPVMCIYGHYYKLSPIIKWRIKRGSSLFLYSYMYMLTMMEKLFSHKTTKSGTPRVRFVWKDEQGRKIATDHSILFHKCFKLRICAFK